MDFLSVTVQLVGLERMLDELELEDNDDALLREVERELDCIEKDGTAQSSLNKRAVMRKNFRNSCHRRAFAMRSKFAQKRS